MNVLIIFGGAGGVVVFGGALLTIIKSIVRQVHATEDNTRALQDLKRTVEGVNGRLNNHGERIARLEGGRR